MKTKIRLSFIFACAIILSACDFSKDSVDPKDYMNNNYKNNSCELQREIMEDKCQNVISYENYNDSCDCGFDEEMNVFPDNPMLAQSYVPIQYMDRVFKPAVGLKMGTIFPELVSPYAPCQSMEEIRYIESMNKIGKGCNKCQ